MGMIFKLTYNLQTSVRVAVRSWNSLTRADFKEPVLQILIHKYVNLTLYGGYDKDPGRMKIFDHIISEDENCENSTTIS